MKPVMQSLPASIDTMFAGQQAFQLEGASPAALAQALLRQLPDSWGMGTQIFAMYAQDSGLVAIAVPRELPPGQHHFADYLVGLSARDCAGLAVVNEGWGISAGGRPSPTGKHADSPDAVEVRHVFVQVKTSVMDTLDTSDGCEELGSERSTREDTVAVAMQLQRGCEQTEATITHDPDGWLHALVTASLTGPLPQQTSILPWLVAIRAGIVFDDPCMSWLFDEFLPDAAAVDAGIGVLTDTELLVDTLAEVNLAEPRESWDGYIRSRAQFGLAPLELTEESLAWFGGELVAEKYARDAYLSDEARFHLVMSTTQLLFEVMRPQRAEAITLVATLDQLQQLLPALPTDDELLDAIGAVITAVPSDAQLDIVNEFVADSPLSELLSLGFAHPDTRVRQVTLCVLIWQSDVDHLAEQLEAITGAPETFCRKMQKQFRQLAIVVSSVDDSTRALPPPVRRLAAAVSQLISQGW